MADNVAVSVATSGPVATIAAEDIGGVEYQRVKLVAGDVGVSSPIGATSGVAASGSMGIVVAPLPGASVVAAVSGTVQVSGGVVVAGTVGISGPVEVSGAVSVSAMPAVSGTVQVAGGSIGVVSTIAAVLGSILVSGTVGISAASSAPAWITGTVTAGAGTTVVSVTGPVNISATSAVPAWITGTVTAGAGTTVISGTVSVSGSTTGASGVSGPIVWLGPNQEVQTVTGSVLITATTPVSVTGVSLGVVVSGVVSVSAMPGVSIVNVVPVTTQSSVSVTGLPMWFSPGATVAIVPGASVTVSGQVVTITGVQTAVVTATTPLSVTGVSVGVVVSGLPGVSVSFPAVSGVIASSVPATSVALGLPVWIVGGQTATGFPVGVSITTGAAISTIANTVPVALATISNTIPVSIAAGVSVTISGQVVTITGVQLASLSALPAAGSQVTVTSGLPVWLAPTQTLAPVQLSGIAPVTTAASVSVTGVPVWLNPTQQVVVSGLVGHSVSLPAVSGVIASSVPATSVALGLPVWIVGGQTATGVPVGVSITTGGVVSVVPGLSVSLPAVSGVVASSAMAASDIFGMPIWIVGGQDPTGVAVKISGTVTAGAGTTVISGTVSVSGSTTGASGVSGPIVWLGPNQAPQTVTGVSVGVVVSGVVSVSVMPAVSGSIALSGTILTAGSPTAISTGLIVWDLPAYSTTAVPSVSATGQVVWVANSTVTVTITVTVTGQLSAVITQLATSGAAVWLAPTQTIAPIQIAASQIVGTVIAVSGVTALSTILNTIAVSVSHPAFSGIIASSVPATSVALGLPVWIVGGQTSTGVPVVVSISSMMNVLTQVATSGMVVWLAPTQTMTVSPKADDAIAFSFTAVSAATVLTPAVCDVAWLGTTLQTSMYVVPVARMLQIQAIQVIVANTAGSVGIAVGQVFVRASLSSSVTVGPVIAFGAAAANTSGTNAGGAGGPSGIGIMVSAGYSVGFAYKMTGGTGHIIAFVIQGVLF